MGYGILQQGQTIKNQALGGLRQAAQNESQRNQTNDTLEAQHKSNKVSGATSGAVAGAMVGGVPGAAIGMVAGYLLPEIL